jgi:hypothetical protein
MYWTLNHQNIIEIAQRHISLSDEDRRGRPSSSPLQDEGKALSKSARPTSSSRPEAHVGLAHCNGPRADKHVTGRVSNSLFCNDGL